jgi:hypothetical protein
MSFPDWVISAGLRERTDYSEFATAPDSIYSCLLPWALHETRTAFNQECRALVAPRIIDAMANIGCDSVNFCRMFPGARVTAVEVDPATAVQLRRNVSADSPARFFRCRRLLDTLERIAGGPLPPIEIVQADCNDYLRGCGAADIVYFDPPWCEAAAAPNAQRPQRRAALEVGGRPLSAVVGETLRRTSPLVVVKLPPDQSGAQFQEEVQSSFGAPVQVCAYDIHKPRGGLAYRLIFVRAAA